MNYISFVGIEEENYNYPVDSFECPQGGGKLTIDSIQNKVEGYFNLPHDSIKIRTRKREIVQARQITMTFAKAMIEGATLASIGSELGDYDHATVLNAMKTVNNLIETDKRFRLQFDEIEKRLKQA